MSIAVFVTAYEIGKDIILSYLQDDTCITVPLSGLHYRLMLITGFVLSYVEIQECTECVVYIKVYSIYRVFHDFRA